MHNEILPGESIDLLGKERNATLEQAKGEMKKRKVYYGWVDPLNNPSYDMGDLTPKLLRLIYPYKRLCKITIEWKEPRRKE